MAAIAISNMSRWAFGPIIQRRQGPAFAIARLDARPREHPNLSLRDSPSGESELPGDFLRSENMGRPGVS